jgi:hypothetical protein
MKKLSRTDRQPSDEPGGAGEDLFSTFERRVVVPLVRCKVRDGLRPSEASVELRDAEGRPEFLPVERDFLHLENGEYYLPVLMFHVDPVRKQAIVTLPVEADSGAHRIWVKLSEMKN